MLERRHGKDKPTSLQRPFVNYLNKKSYNVGPRISIRSGSLWIKGGGSKITQHSFLNFKVSSSIRQTWAPVQILIKSIPGLFHIKLKLRLILNSSYLHIKLTWMCNRKSLPLVYYTSKSDLWTLTKCDKIHNRDVKILVKLKVPP